MTRCIILIPARIIPTLHLGSIIKQQSSFRCVQRTQNSNCQFTEAGWCTRGPGPLYTCKLDSMPATVIIKLHVFVLKFIQFLMNLKTLIQRIFKQIEQLILNMAKSHSYHILPRRFCPNQLQQSRLHQRLKDLHTML